MKMDHYIAAVSLTAAVLTVTTAILWRRRALNNRDNSSNNNNNSNSSTNHNNTETEPKTSDNGPTDMEVINDDDGLPAEVMGGGGADGAIKEEEAFEETRYHEKYNNKRLKSDDVHEGSVDAGVKDVETCVVTAEEDQVEVKEVEQKTEDQVEDTKEQEEEGEQEVEEVTPPKFVISVGAHGLQGKRKTMEDAHIAVMDLRKWKAGDESADLETLATNGDMCALFAVLDGHGGKKAADFVAVELPRLLSESMEELKTEPIELLHRSYLEIERLFIERAVAEQMEDGTTAVSAVLLGEADLFVSTLGDSEAVLCRNRLPMALSSVHNPAKNFDEMERVKAAGGRIYNKRVGHPHINCVYFNLAVSRSIGDLMYKHTDYTSGKVSGVIADPDTVKVTMNKSDDFLLLACDGVWDVMTHAQAVEFILENFDAGETNLNTICQRLCERSLIRGSMDNVTALIVRLVPGVDGEADTQTQESDVTTTEESDETTEKEDTAGEEGV